MTDVPVHSSETSAAHASGTKERKLVGNRVQPDGGHVELDVDSDWLSFRPLRLTVTVSALGRRGCLRDCLAGVAGASEDVEERLAD